MHLVQKPVPAAQGDCCQAVRPACSTLEVNTYQRGVLPGVRLDASPLHFHLTHHLRGGGRAADHRLHSVLMLLADVLHVHYHYNTADAPNDGVSIAEATAVRARLLLSAFDPRAA
jgi:hypothetical protein